MTSTGDAFRRKTAEDDASLTPAERVQRALRLGDDEEAAPQQHRQLVDAESRRRDER